MNHKKYTISHYYDKNTPLFNYQISKAVEPLDGYDSISEIFNWCKINNVYVDTVLVTEWDLDDIDAYGIPSILEQNNLSTLII